MGLQQLLLVILGVILVGLAVLAGVVMFQHQAMMAHRQAIIVEMNQTMLDATAYNKLSRRMGGGGGSYWGFLPAGAVTYSAHIGSPANVGYKLETTEVNYFVEYWAEGSYPQRVTVTASSKLYGEGNYWANTYNARIVASFDANGMIITNSSRKGFVISGNWKK